MSRHINFYNIDFEKFNKLIGSKDQVVVEQAIFVVKNRLLQRRALNDSLKRCSQLIRRIILEAKFPDQVDDFYLPLDDFYLAQDSQKTVQGLTVVNSFEFIESILAILNKVNVHQEYKWLPYHDCLEVYQEIALIYNLTEQQTQCWQFLLKGRSLRDEDSPKGLWASGYGYLLRSEIELLLKSLQPLSNLRAGKDAIELYNLLTSYEGFDVFFTMA